MNVNLLACRIPGTPGYKELTLVRVPRQEADVSRYPSWMQRCADMTRVLPPHLLTKRNPVEVR